MHWEGMGGLRRVADLLVGEKWLQETAGTPGVDSPTIHLPRIRLHDFPLAVRETPGLVVKKSVLNLTPNLVRLF
jgi:hypothetical protein